MNDIKAMPAKKAVAKKRPEYTKPDYMKLLESVDNSNNGWGDEAIIVAGMYLSRIGVYARANFETGEQMLVYETVENTYRTYLINLEELTNALKGIELLAPDTEANITRAVKQSAVVITEPDFEGVKITYIDFNNDKEVSHITIKSDNPAIIDHIIDGLYTTIVW